MGWVIKKGNQYVSGFDDDEAQFTDDFNCAWWWTTQDNADWFIETNDIEDVESEDSGGENPPGNGQPGKP
jgi:hypothetical protein